MSNREYAKGMAKAKENDFLAAIEHFTIAISEDENNVEYYAERAVAYLNSGQYDLSLFDMNRCVDFEPNNSYRYSCRAFLKAKMNDPDGAIIDYEIAVKLDPEDAIAFNNLGLAQEQKGYRDKAARSFERSNELIGYDPLRRQQESNAGGGSSSGSGSGGRVARDVFTKKESFRDFLRFIRNGFKLKK
jgi:tetratricopeptide (TPR) repeat protein